MIKDDIQSGVAPASLTSDESQLDLAAPAPPIEKIPAELTPFMRQWTVAKRENPDALLFFRMGDFYELFYDDAIVVSRELQLTLTARDRERNQPMCGVPYHAVEGYLARLLRKGYRIAICDQMEDPKLTKKIVRREVTRVLSPGTALDSALGQEQNNFLAAYFEIAPGHPEKSPSNSKSRFDPEPQALKQRPRTSAADSPLCAVALLDISTGEFRTAEFSGPAARQQAVDEILMSGASEVLLPATAPIPPQLERVPARTRVEDWVWTRDFAIPLVERQLHVRSLEGFGLVGHEPAAVAAGVVLHYVRTTQKNDALHIDSLRFQEHSTALELDQVTVRNLELVEPLFAGQLETHPTAPPSSTPSMPARTPMGKRLLRATILRPLMDAAAIESRYEAVAEAHADLVKREEIRRAFSGILDLERLLARISLDSAGPRDIRALASSTARLPALKTALEAMQAARWHELVTLLDTLEDVTVRIATTLVAEPPLTLADGGAIAAGVDR